MAELGKLTIETDEKYYRMIFEPGNDPGMALWADSAGAFIGPDFCSYDFTRERFENFDGFVASAVQYALRYDRRLFQNIPHPPYSDDPAPCFEHTDFEKPYEIVPTRTYTEEVRQGVALVYHSLNGKNVSRLDTEEGELFQENLQATIEAPQSTLLVARKKDETATIIGVAVVNVLQTLGNTKAYLDDLAVDPEQRGQGVGKSLYAEIIQIALNSGAEKLEFTSHPTRTAAHELYLAAGAEKLDTVFFRHELD